jgi:hypothetical protein
MDIICYFANLKICGTEYSTNDKGMRTLNRLPFSVDGYDFELVQDSAVLRTQERELIGTFIESTRLYVNNVEPENTKVICQIARRLAYMLSLATDSQVRFYRWHAVNCEEGQRWSVNGVYNYFRPPLCTIETIYLKSFIEGGYATYKQLEEVRTLKVAIELFVTSDALEQPVELRLANIFILLENLKHSYAKNHEYEYIKGAWFKGGKRIGFKQILIDMFDSVGMSPEVSGIIKLRNEIIHSGLSEMGGKEKYQVFSVCKELSGEYLFRLMGYQGKFYRHSTNGNQSKMLSQV